MNAGWVTFLIIFFGLLFFVGLGVALFMILMNSKSAMHPYKDCTEAIIPPGTFASGQALSQFNLGTAPNQVSFTSTGNIPAFSFPGQISPYAFLGKAIAKTTSNLPASAKPDKFFVNQGVFFYDQTAGTIQGMYGPTAQLIIDDTFSNFAAEKATILGEWIQVAPSQATSSSLVLQHCLNVQIGNSCFLMTILEITPGGQVIPLI